jgi:hypothetical protein
MASKAGFTATVRRFEHYSEIHAVHNKNGGACTASVHLRRVSATTEELFSWLYPGIGTA